MSAPLETIWQALERAGCEPHGRPWAFRSRCPAHKGENREALAVCEGVDRRVVVHCFARGCAAREIAAALGLELRDLFPPGHRHARRVSFPPVRRSDLDGGAREAANVLLALDTLGVDWTVRIGAACAFCGSDGAELVLRPNGTRTLFCATGCVASEFVGGLASRLRDGHERAA